MGTLESILEQLRDISSKVNEMVDKVLFKVYGFTMKDEQKRLLGTGKIPLPFRAYKYILTKMNKDTLFLEERESKMDYTLPLPDWLYNIVYRTDKRIPEKQMLIILDSVISSLEVSRPESSTFATLATLNDLSTYTRKVCYDVSKRLLEGESLYACFERYSKLFGEDTLPIMQAGHLSSTMIRSLKNIQLKIEKRMKNKSALRKMMFVPVSVIAILVIGLTIIGIWLMPEVFETLDLEGQTLPPRLNAMMKMTEFLTSYKIVFLLLGIVVIYQLFTRVTMIKKFGHYITMQIPIINKAIRYYYSINFLTEYSFLMDTQATSDQRNVEIALQNIHNTYMNYVFTETYKDLLKYDKTFSECSENVYYFPELVRYVLRETSELGNLTIGLERALAYMEDEFEDLVEKTQNILPVILLIMVAIIILMVAPIINELQDLYTIDTGNF